MIDTDNRSCIKVCSTTADPKNPLKKVHCVSNKMFVVIDEAIVRRLAINENDTWFEQIQTEDGILLRKHQYSLH